MPQRCAWGHPYRGKLARIYVTVDDGTEDGQRAVRTMCPDHMNQWFKELSSRTEDNGVSNRGPFQKRRCHWGDHEFENGWSDGAVFLLAFLPGDVRVARRALLCQHHLVDAAQEVLSEPL